MTPGARIDAALRALEAIGSSPQNADAVLRDFFKSRRYAGAHDRRAVTDMVYGLLRQQGELLWRCGEDAPWRRLMIAYLALHEGRDLPGVEALFDGDRYGPESLSAAERSWLPTLAGDAPPPPTWAQGNFPAWLSDDLGEQFGDALLDEMTALNQPAAVDLRINALRATREEVAEALAAEGIETTPGRWSPDALRLARPRRLTRHPLFLQGAIEVQDEGSQLVGLLVDAQPGQQVVDLCAGAGGKTLELAAAMKNSGQIYAFDTHGKRLARMKPRLDRAGVRNVQTHRLPTAVGVLDELAGKADRVLVDAPCSGTGTWRRHPSARWRLRPAHLAAHHDVQPLLLRQAADLVRPGGRLIYATCSVLMSEDQAPVRAFLADRPDFRAVPAEEAWAAVLPGVAMPARAAVEPGLLLTPRRHDTDAFYVAVLERGEGA
jgi:16S rRNA (cytosine967-C5)-methyltransferase